MDNNTPTVVKIHDVNIDKDYINWIEELKSRYRSAQIKAAVKVNAEKLHFNWELNCTSTGNSAATLSSAKPKKDGAQE